MAGWNQNAARTISSISVKSQSRRRTWRHSWARMAARMRAFRLGKPVGSRITGLRKPNVTGLAISAERRRFGKPFRPAADDKKRSSAPLALAGTEFRRYRRQRQKPTAPPPGAGSRARRKESQQELGLCEPRWWGDRKRRWRRSGSRHGGRNRRASTHIDYGLRPWARPGAEQAGRQQKVPVGQFRARQAQAEQRRNEARQTHRSEEHTSELQSLRHLVCRLLL